MRSFGISLYRLVAAVTLLMALALGQSPGEIKVGSAPYTFAPVIVANANTLPLTVVVRDRDGNVIHGIPEQDFRISEDGKPQTPTSFEVEAAPTAEGGAAGESAGAPPPATAAGAGAAAPRYVALLFDDVNSAKADLAEARNAAARFLREELGPGDEMAVFTISGNQNVGFTQDRAALMQAVAQISPHRRAKNTTDNECPRMTAYEAYLIAEMHDQGTIGAMESEAQACAPNPTATPVISAAMQACGLKCTFGGPPVMGSSGVPVEMQAEADWQMARGVAQDTLATLRSVVDFTAKQPGQRIVVLASSGFLSETLGNEKEQVIHDALRGGVVINALDATGIYGGATGLSLQEESETGARILPLAAYILEEAVKFPAREAQSDAKANFSEATGGLYFQNNNDLTLGFERLGLAPAASYEPTYTPTPLVRDGKLHAIKVELEPPIKGATIQARRGYFAPPPGLTESEAELALYNGMKSNATASAVPADVMATTMTGEVKVSVRTGVTQPDERVATVAGLFGADGRFVTGERGELDLTLKKGTFKKLQKTGLTPSFFLKAPAGQYKLRVVVLDEVSGAVSEFNREVQVK